MERLSDPQQRRREIEQLGCYLAVVLMDDPAAQELLVRAAVERITGPLEGATDAFAESGEESRLCARHLFLRWLVRQGDPAGRLVTERTIPVENRRGASVAADPVLAGAAGAGEGSGRRV